jgi:hypothetical protein
MNQQKTKIRIEKDVNVLRERVRMKEEATPQKLLSSNGAIVFFEQLSCSGLSTGLIYI